MMSYQSLILNVCRGSFLTSKACWSTINVTKPGVSSIDPKKAKNYANQRKMLREYFGDNLPPKCLSRFPTSLTLLHKETADKVFKLIAEVVSENPVPLLEMHPGPGLLTQKLLDRGMSNLYAFEPRLCFNKDLKELLKRYNAADRLVRRPMNDIFCENRKNMTADSPYLVNQLPFTLSKAWNDAPSFRILGAHSSIQVWLWILLNISQSLKFYNYGRPEAIVAVPKIEWEKLFNSGTSIECHRIGKAGILFPDFFEWELIGEVPRKAYMPWKVTQKTVNVKDDDYMCVVKLAPSIHIFDEINCEELGEMMHFIEQHANKSTIKCRVIPTLEKWIPGCGRNLVLRGYNVCQTFSNLSPKQFLEVFLIFKSHPEYMNSSFLVSMKDSYSDKSPKIKSRRKK